MALKGKELLYVCAIFFACFAFPALALIVITWAVLASHPD
jgi:hypothetical protein